MVFFLAPHKLTAPNAFQFLDAFPGISRRRFLSPPFTAVRRLIHKPVLTHDAAKARSDTPNTLKQRSKLGVSWVVLLELISGLKAVDQRRDKGELALADMMVSKIQMGLLHQVVDPVLIVDGNVADGVDVAAELAFRCVAAEKDDRPDAREVVEELKRNRNRPHGISSALSSARTCSRQRRRLRRQV